jgi:hypothetical protein
MTTYMKVQPSTGQAVQLFDSELKLDPTIYKVIAQDRNIINLKIVCTSCKDNTNQVASCKTCNGTGEVGKRRVHHSRIARVLDDTFKVIYEVDSLTKEKPVTQEKQAAKATTPATNAPDLKTLVGSGEHFTKTVSFDHANVAAQAHVVINPDHKSFIVFNTYNGALGKVKPGKTYGKQYPIADEKAYTEKVNQLSKQGYVKS